MSAVAILPPNALLLALPDTLFTNVIRIQNFLFSASVMAAQRVVIRSPILDRIIRVDHAGELAAKRIYQGQLLVLGKSSVGPVIKEMQEQEEVHLRTFEELIPRHRIRPTALLPFWNIAGLALGVGTALLGSKAAMACTVAVESVISEHYNDQIRQLMASDDSDKYTEVLQVLKKFRDEEIEHHDTGLHHGAEQAPAYTLLSEVIKAGCRASIFLAERI
ncbi:hypothetical protein P879_11452 [Paragonimus westermani]|uniref:5-demethoxyubiquinone hydroxylase, mitochondrial n=1 Tax=Paragonimus westermani TaxID=34504 RepID=A0A8T0D8N2_9TREM|nr:hypothetical protein P879_11452 [Paragonimus westermani]